MKAKERNTFALSTRVTRPGVPRSRLRRLASAQENSVRRSVVARVMTWVSRASASPITSPFPREANMPSVDSRTMTRSIRSARGSASTRGTPGMARIGRTPA